MRKFWIKAVETALILIVPAVTIFAGSPTLKTITVDGDMSDWANVITNPVQYVTDGTSSSNCALSTDRDCPISSTGRDLTGFAWTYDNTNIYLYVKRVGSSSNTDTFIFAMDVDQNKLMDSGDYVLEVAWQGSNRTTGIVLYRYIPANPGGDPLVDANGYADGYSLPGSLGAQVWSDYAHNGGSASGTEMETYVPWAQLGVPTGTPIYYHVASSINSHLNKVVDNLGGQGGGMGAFGYYQGRITPDRTGSTQPGGSVSYSHTLTDSGTFADTYDLKVHSSMGYRLDLYVNGTLVGTDATGNGSFSDPGDYLAPGWDSNGDGYPDISLASGGTAAVTLKVTSDSSPASAADAATVTETSEGDGSSTTATDTTYVGTVTLSPDHSGDAAAGMTATYTHTLTNLLAPGNFRITDQSTAGFRVDLYQGSTWIATDLTGDGTWDSVASAYNPGGSGVPEIYASNNASVSLTVIITPPPGTPLSTVDRTTIQAEGVSNGGSAAAVDTTTVMNRLTLSPSYLISNGTNHYGAAGTAVYFAHTLTNAGPQADTFDFYAAGYAPVSSAGYTVTIYSDPNGDGNPADGTVITHTPPVTANGGVFHFVVEIDVPAAVAPPATDSTQITAVRCTDSSCSGSDTSVAASVTDETKVAYIIPFQDSLYSIQGSLFAPCSTVYPEGVNLVPDQYNRYELVYKTPSGATAATRVLQDDNTGTLRDSFTFPATAAQGKWTITLMDTITSPATQLDSATVTLERNTSISAVPAPLGHPASGAPLVAAVSLVNGNSGAPLTNTRVNYLVLDPSGTEYLQSTGTFTTYTGGLTASHGTFDVAQQTSGADTLSIPSVTYPSYGIYTLCAIWEAECGSDNNPADDLASQCLNIYVVTWASYSDSGHTAPSSSFEVPAAVYLDGAGFGASMPYVEAVYGPGGTLITTKALTSGSNQHLSDSLASTTLAGIGTYHAVVYPPSATPPAVYTPSDPHIIAETAFGVTLSPPALQGPASAGDTRVSGTSTKPAGTPVTLYLNGTAVGTGTVQSGGGFTITSDTPFSQGNVLTAKQTVSGVQSSPSNSLTVAADTFAFSTPATNTLLNRVDDRNLQAPGYQTYISGTGKPGASVTVTDGAGNLLGNAVVQSDGTWAVTVTLTVGNSYSFTVTQSDAAGNTRTATHTGISFDPRPNLLRSDAISTLAPTTPTLSSILTTHSPSLLIWGPNGVADRGEGALLDGNGSSDDDDFYIASIDSGLLDPDVPVASDTNRPLVFYQLDTPGNTLRLTKVKDSSGNIRIKISY